MGDLPDITQINQKPVEELTYEQAFAEFEHIMSALESGEHSLELSLSLYERGQKLAHYCTDLLDKAELKIKQLSGEDIIPFTPPD